MKFWTVQKVEALNQIRSDGAYFPDFKKSAFVESNPRLDKLYGFLLESFNNINDSQYPGLIFSFLETWSDSSYHGFKEFIWAREPVIASLWKSLSTDLSGTVVMELNVPYPFLNTLLIDINDFQYLMPPFNQLPPYTENDVPRILNSMRQGIIPDPRLPSGLMQGHLPFIEKDAVVAIHPMFEI